MSPAQKTDQALSQAEVHADQTFTEQACGEHSVELEQRASSAAALRGCMVACTRAIVFAIRERR